MRINYTNLRDLSSQRYGETRTIKFPYGLPPQKVQHRKSQAASGEKSKLLLAIDIPVDSSDIMCYPWEDWEYPAGEWGLL